MKALNLLRVVARANWGSDEATLLHLYRSLIRSKLDYGAIVYGSARKSQGCRGYGDSHGDSYGYGYGMDMWTVMNPHGFCG